MYLPSNGVVINFDIIQFNKTFKYDGCRQCPLDGDGCTTVYKQKKMEQIWLLKNYCSINPSPGHNVGVHIEIIVYIERSKQVWTGVTGVSLCTADALAAGNGQRRIAVTQPHTFPYLFYKLSYLPTLLTELLELSTLVVHTFLATLYKISHSSPLLMLLISSRILRYAGFVAS